MKKTLPVILSVFIGMTAYAKAPLPPDRTIFSCTIKGKQLTIHRHGSDYIYSFGRKGRKPELTFCNPRKEVAARSGNSDKDHSFRMWGETRMKNGNYEYSIMWFINKELDVVHRLKITHGDHQYLDEVDCDKRYPVISNTDWEFMI